jgi:hypothetical protein
LYDALGEEVTEARSTGEVYVRSVSFGTYYKADDRAAEARRGDFATVGILRTRDQEVSCTSATTRAT